ncbi:translocator protein 2 [Sminthopsis crassicaudata]|uniref:translocator protein 2 n=1 Tax=Sminthopsis crassicaudata TaxID=9301 RepID=UPI003D68CEE6
MWPQSTFFMALPHVGPIAGWLFAQQHMPTWYKTLKKPPWWPPNKFFLIVWTVTYSTMGYASYLVWKDLGGGFGRSLALPLGLYATQLVLNWIILLLFFGAHNLGLALCHLLLLYGLVLGMALSWQSINGLAVLLLLPYLAWLTLTTSLAYRLWMDDSSSEPQLSFQPQLQSLGEKID